MYVLALVALYMDILWSLKLLKQAFWCTVNEYVLNELRISTKQQLFNINVNFSTFILVSLLHRKCKVKSTVHY